MSEGKSFLEKVHIQNFLSLRNVVLPLKPLTVLVGPNASGKSNALSALSLLKTMIVAEKLPPADFIQDSLWAGEASRITFQLEAKVNETPAIYKLELEAKTENPIVFEELMVKEVKVISVQNGEGEVKDEDNTNPTKYRSNKLALKSAGDYGNKPVTSALTEFIKGWEFYDFQPSQMRGNVIFQIMEGVSRKPADLREPPILDDEGIKLATLLSYWYKNDHERFQAVNEALEACTNLKIDQCLIDGDDRLCLLEGYKKPIPLRKASDGTLRLMAYHILLSQSKIPSLIAIEEPERNLHPAALTYIVNVLEQLAEQTQVIITTHSSQLLDAFNPKSLSGYLGVLLLRNVLGKGTEVINLENTRQDRTALDGWIEDFGLGSAIFDSELLQDVMGGSACQV